MFTYHCLLGALLGQAWLSPDFPMLMGEQGAYPPKIAVSAPGQVELYDPAADQWVLLGPLRAVES